MSEPARTQKLVSCPGCGRQSAWSTTNPFRPFCSERCKLIDFGQWATGSYRIAQEEADAGNLEANADNLGAHADNPGADGNRTEG